MGGYTGQVIEIAVGQDGMHCDDPNSMLTPGTSLVARNLNYQNKAMEKAAGSMRWNRVVLPAAVRGGLDWWPENETQRLISICSDGKVYRFENPTAFTEVTATQGSPITINPTAFVSMVTGGSEDIGNPRKIFIMTGYDPVQVISGDGTTRTTIANPTSDFSGTSQPSHGVIFQGRLFVIVRGSSTVYASESTNHEDFATLPLPYQCYPGESEYVSDIFVFKGNLFALKYPRGLYVLNSSDPNAQNWYFQKLNGAFGGSNPKCTIQCMDDCFIGTEYGGVTSLTATNATGDVKSADIFANLRMQSFLRAYLSQDGRNIRQGFYYTDKKQALWIYRGKTSIVNNYFVMIDFTNPQNPHVIFHDKDQPNFIFGRKDSYGIERPFYGSNDGYLYSMDSPNYWVGSIDQSVEQGYLAEFQTPHMDLSSINPVYGDMNKNWDFLEVFYEPCGQWNLSIDAYVDGRFHKTLQFNMGDGSGITQSSDLDNFSLDSNTTSAESELRARLPLQGSGQTISFRGYNSIAGQNFKITKMRVYFKLAGQQERK